MTLLSLIGDCLPVGHEIPELPLSGFPNIFKLFSRVLFCAIGIGFSNTCHVFDLMIFEIWILGCVIRNLDLVLLRVLFW